MRNSSPIPYIFTLNQHIIDFVHLFLDLGCNFIDWRLLIRFQGLYFSFLKYFGVWVGGGIEKVSE